MHEGKEHHKKPEDANEEIIGKQEETRKSFLSLHNVQRKGLFVTAAAVSSQVELAKVLDVPGIGDRDPFFRLQLDCPWPCDVYHSEGAVPHWG